MVNLFYFIVEFYFGFNIKKGLEEKKDEKMQKVTFQSLGSHGELK